jgi:hypothetical protein
MRPIRSSAILIAICVTGLLISPVLGAGIPWTNANGSSPGFFSWENGNNETNLFGDPIPIGNKLVFFPSNYRAESTGGVPDQAFDKISVDIIAAGNLNITAINIQEIGDYAILGQGASVQASGGLVVTPINFSAANPADPKADALDTTPNFPVTSGSGLWSGNATVTYTLENGVKKIHLTFDNTLQATSDGDSTSLIDKKLTQGIIIEIIPEPTTIGLLLCGAPLVLRRRRSA